MAAKACKELVNKCGFFGGGKETPQFLILGLEGAGKTTLLYKLKFGTTGNECAELAKKLADLRVEKEDFKTLDPGYHYEDFTNPWNHGMWEVPGTQAMRQMWPAFYHAIKIHCVVFVVDGMEVDDQKITVAKKLLHVLMNEDELRKSCFVVIINEKKARERDKDALETNPDRMYYKLGLHTLHASCEKRTRWFPRNVLEMKPKQWQDVLEWVKTVLNKPEPHGFGFKIG